MSQLAASRSAFSSRSSVTSRQSAASAAVGRSRRQKTASAATTSLANGPMGFSAGLHEGSFASQRGRGWSGATHLPSHPDAGDPSALRQSLSTPPEYIPYGVPTSPSDCSGRGSSGGNRGFDKVSTLTSEGEILLRQRAFD